MRKEKYGVLETDRTLHITFCSFSDSSKLCGYSIDASDDLAFPVGQLSQVLQ